MSDLTEILTEDDTALFAEEIVEEDAGDVLGLTGTESAADEETAAVLADPSNKAKPSNNKALIRRVALKAQELLDAPTKHIAVAAHLLGSSVELPDLTTAIMTAPRSALNPLLDVKELGTMSPLEAGINVVAMGRPRIRGVWGLLASAGVVSKASLPAADAKAAMAIVTAVDGLNDDALATFEGAAQLLRKS